MLVGQPGPYGPDVDRLYFDEAAGTLVRLTSAILEVRRSSLGPSGCRAGHFGACSEQAKRSSLEMRARDLGIVVGDLPTGPLNSLTDVKGVRVGHVTLESDSDREEARMIRTGVTAVVPAPGNLFVSKVPAAAHVINGFGKAAGLTQINELGTLETPIVLTNTLCVGSGLLGLVEYTLELNPGIRSVNGVVAECNDGWLSDIGALSVGPEHVREAISAATDGLVEEGAAGAGTGMMCYGWKGGIGTSSRCVQGDAEPFVVGVLVLANFGHPEDLCVCGVNVGSVLTPATQMTLADGQTGSCIVVIGTSAPVDARQLARLARRAQTGLARTGTYGEHGSGEYAIAFSTGCRVETSSEDPSSAATNAAHTDVARVLREDGQNMNHLFKAVVEATEEAVLNALFAGRPVKGVKGRRALALPPDRVLELVREREAGR